MLAQDRVPAPFRDRPETGRPRSRTSGALFFPGTQPMSFVLAAMLTALAPLDEGMWTFDNPPMKQLQEKYGFTPDAAWLEHLRLSSVRFNSGGSGSFVSSEGLVMTNHHVGLDTLHKISTAEKDYVKNGFFAAAHDQEVPSADLELNVL